MRQKKVQKVEKQERGIVVEIGHTVGILVVNYFRVVGESSGANSCDSFGVESKECPKTVKWLWGEVDDRLREKFQQNLLEVNKVEGEIAVAWWSW